MNSDFVKIEGTQFNIAALAGVKKDDFMKAYTGVIMDVNKAWEEAKVYARKKPVIVKDSEE